MDLPNCYGHWTDEGHYVAVAMKSRGATPQEIAAELNTSVKNVIRNLPLGPPSKRVKKRTVPVKCNKEKLLRLRILKRIVPLYVNKVGNNGRIVRHRLFPTATALLAQCIREGAKPVKKRQINVDLHTLGYGAKRRGRGPRRYHLDESKRVIFCKDHKRDANDPEIEWIFTDEKKATIQDGQVVFEYVKDGEKPEPMHNEQCPASVHMWGAISKKWRKLHIFTQDDGRLNQHTYVQVILEPNKTHIAGPKRRFYQDGAKAHTSYYALGSMELLGVQYVQSAARSPDLNPIENVWALLMQRVQTHDPTSVEELCHWLKKEFSKITQAELNRYIESFPRRLDECIRMRGKTIRT